ncbi:hypothetical protein AB4K20DRAFT_1954296 [Rhizopus microsporus]
MSMTESTKLRAISLPKRHQLRLLAMCDSTAMSGYYTIFQRKPHFRNYRKKQKALNELRRHLFSGSHKHRPEDCFENHQCNSEK